MLRLPTVLLALVICLLATSLNAQSLPGEGIPPGTVEEVEFMPVEMLVNKEAGTKFKPQDQLQFSLPGTITNTGNVKSIYRIETVVTRISFNPDDNGEPIAQEMRVELAPGKSYSIPANFIVFEAEDVMRYAVTVAVYRRNVNGVGKESFVDGRGFAFERSAQPK